MVSTVIYQEAWFIIFAILHSLCLPLQVLSALAALFGFAPIFIREIFLVFGTIVLVLIEIFVSQSLAEVILAFETCLMISTFAMVRILRNWAKLALEFASIKVWRDAYLCYWALYPAVELVDVDASRGWTQYGVLDASRMSEVWGAGISVMAMVLQDGIKVHRRSQLRLILGISLAVRLILVVVWLKIVWLVLPMLWIGKRTKIVQIRGHSSNERWLSTDSELVALLHLHLCLVSVVLDVLLHLDEFCTHWVDLVAAGLISFSIGSLGKCHIFRFRKCFM